MSDATEPAEALDPAEIALTEAPTGPGIVLGEGFAGLSHEGAHPGAHLGAIPSLDARIALVERLAGCGFRRIAVGGFAPADPDQAPPIAEAVLRGVRRRPGVLFQAACDGLPALHRALDAKSAGHGPDEVQLAVPQDGQWGQGQWTEVAEMARLAGDTFPLVGTIAAAFDGPADPRRVLDAAERFAALGVTRIAIADAGGSATPPRVRDLIGWLHGALPTASFIARFGDRRGTGIANALAAVEAGLTHVDCALGGGPEAAAETCTEDLALALQAMGHATGLDLAGLREAGLEAERLLGRPLHSRTLRLVEVRGVAT